MIKQMMIDAFKEVLKIQDDNKDTVVSLLDVQQRLTDENTRLSEERDRLQEAASQEKIRLNELRDTQSREKKEVEHLVKMAEERNAIALQKAIQEKTGEFQEKELKMQKEYHEQMASMAKENNKAMREMYEQISKTLADAVNVDISKGNIPHREKKED